MLTPAQEKKLAQLLRKALRHPDLVFRSANGIRVKAGGAVREYPAKSSAQRKERDIA